MMTCWCLRECVCTYYNEENEVDEVVKRMCIHNVVHDVYPTFQSNYLDGCTHTEL